MSTVVRWLKKFNEPFHIESNAWAARSASGMCWDERALHQVAQNGHILWPGIGKVGLVDHLYRPVNDGFSMASSPSCCHDELAEG